MKKAFFTICIMALFYLSNAQGNLQFNQVVRVKNTVSATTFVNTYTITVPAGVVWKLESASAIIAGATNYSISTFVMFIDNQPVYTGGSSLSNAFPVWLAPGTYNVVLYQESATTYTVSCVINGLEFKVVP
jgi:hypothetical protein